jgi:hypothetical protein
MSARSRRCTGHCMPRSARRPSCLAATTARPVPWITSGGGAGCHPPMASKMPTGTGDRPQHRPAPRSPPVFGRQALTPVCGTLRLAAHLNNHLGVNNDEQGAPSGSAQRCAVPGQRSGRACATWAKHPHPPVAASTHSHPSCTLMTSRTALPPWCAAGGGAARVAGAQRRPFCGGQSLAAVTRAGGSADTAAKSHRAAAQHVAEQLPRRCGLWRHGQPRLLPLRRLASRAAAGPGRSPRRSRSWRRPARARWR